MTYIKDFLNWAKQNIRDLIDFLKSNSIEIHVKSKKTEETTKHIVVSNLFVVIVILLVIAIIYGFIKVKTIFFP
jgi:hypothetical protein